MLFTSAEAAKLLKEKKEAYEAILAKENLASTFDAYIGEAVEDARPAFAYSKTQEDLRKLEADIRTIKHAINCFNLSHEVPGFQMTVDQMLIYIPQLTEMKKKYDKMRRRLPKQRKRNDGYLRSSNLVEYTYINYPIEDAEKDFQKTAETLSKAQTALDALNSSERFEINI
ncbi:MAG: hypothetical protein IJR00_11490 [Lachnospiraceae bacterium]|nr:hypothetical protein [Lachnospiraceae bacterium]